ncbi:hypothetical protein A9Q81_05815 [Gammaproteobacteria bacterium 42_54_T18]|nr:hypothetical protein A9Q81_05815 [Gammaproteobacteria bacterium 42_54_T18]
MRRNNRIDWFFYISFLLIGVMSVTNAHAVEIGGLYDAQVEVVDRDSQTFRGATQDALAEVIVRVSGNSHAIESPEVVTALSKPDRYLLQFGYEKMLPKDPVANLGMVKPLLDLAPDSEKGSMFDEPDVAVPELLLRLQFDPKAINQLLRRAGLPIWASNRPEILLWLGAELEGQRQLVSPSSSIELSGLLLKESHRRGLPLSMPIYDLQDQAVVSIGDIWGMFTDRLIEASSRYPVTGVLMAKVYQNNDGLWVGSWTLSVDGQSEWFDSEGDTAADAIAQAVDWAADQMAAKFAILASAGETDVVTLQISGIQQLTSYANVSKYLGGLVAIRRVQMQELNGDVLTFQVYLESDKEQLQQSLKLDGHLALLGAINPVASILTTDTLRITDTLPLGAADPEVLIIDGELIDNRIADSESTVLESQPSPNKPQRTVLLYRWKG